jgi:hypothetical protein
MRALVSIQRQAVFRNSRLQKSRQTILRGQRPRLQLLRLAFVADRAKATQLDVHKSYVRFSIFGAPKRMLPDLYSTAFPAFLIASSCQKARKVARFQNKL